MSQLPPTVVFLKRGTVLTDAQRLDLLARALRVHFHSEFATVREHDAEKMARSLAQQLVERSNECGLRHLSEELGRHVELSAPSAEECDSLKEALDKVVKIRYSESDGPAFGTQAFGRSEERRVG